MTEERRDVEVSGGKGVIVGDYATVFQSFGDSGRPVSSFIRSAQFRSLVDERTRNFVGREFVFDAIQRVSAGGEFASGYVLVRGEPGIGKTAIAAMLLCFLAISREPVTIPQLMEWTHLEPGDIKDVISRWRGFLNEDPQSRPPRFRIYHSSFRDFLDDEVALSDYHRAVAVSALGKIPGFFDDQ